jgi:alkanesulfonate monooxygenase SsuD/methylene tetrahydromethanopterin reductase-like flavin-dependent oxidoreductase (luciferase family)
VGGGSEAALRRAARFGDGWIGAFASERKFARLAGALRGFLAEGGRPAEAFTLGTVLFVNVDEDRSRAQGAAISYLDRVYWLPGERVIERYGAAGPVEACVERLLAYVAAGARYLVLYPVCDHREWPRQLDRYGEIIARVASHAGGR